MRRPRPVNQTACVNTRVTFTPAATGNPAPTVQWQVNMNGGFRNIPGATSPTLTFTFTIAGGLEYRAIFTNSAGTATTGCSPAIGTPRLPAPWSGAYLRKSISSNEIDP